MDTGVNYVDPQGVAAFFLMAAFVTFCCGCYIYGYLNEKVKPIFQKFNEENVSLLRGFDIDHSEDIPTIVQEVPITQVAKKNKPDDKLVQGCIAVLVSLGAKKGEAKTIATDFFKHHPETETVEDFIRGHYGH